MYRYTVELFLFDAIMLKGLYEKEQFVSRSYFHIRFTCWNWAFLSYVRFLCYYCVNYMATFKLVFFIIIFYFELRVVRHPHTILLWHHTILHQLSIFPHNSLSLNSCALLFQTVSVPAVAEVVPRQPVRHIHEPQNNYANAEEYASNVNNKSVAKERNAKGHRVECSNWCSVCNKSFSSRYYLKLHESLHNGQYRYCCEVCRKQFVSLSNLKVHQHIHNGQRPFSCDLCKKSFTQKSDLKEHLASHSNDCPFYCQLCNKSFKLQRELKKHLRTHSGERHFSCDLCKKSFTQNSHLKEHLTSHSNERPFDCEVCNKSFKLQKHLKEHLRIHSREYSFSCNLCKKSFTQKIHLKEHLASHNNERPTDYQVCNKSLKLQKHLKKHLPIHSREHSFSCNLCKKSFTQKSHLKEHLPSHYLAAKCEELNQKLLKESAEVLAPSSGV